MKKARTAEKSAEHNQKLIKCNQDLFTYKKMRTYKKSEKHN